MTKNPKTLQLNPRALVKNSTVVAFVVTTLVWLASSLFIRGFATYQHNIQFAQTSVYLGFMAVGQAMVVISGGFDLSISSVVTLSSVITSAMAHSGQGVAVSIAVALLASLAVGIFNAAGITFLRIQPMIMTLATVSLLEGILLIATNGTPPSGVHSEITWMAKGQLVPGIPNVLLIYLFFILILIWFMHFSKWGFKIYGLGSNERASWLSGVRIFPMKFMIYGLSSLCGGISGVLLLGYIGSTYLTIGAPYQMFTVAATVMGGISITGGRGNFIGIIAGTFLFSAIRDILTVTRISAAGRELFQGLLILLVILIYGREKRRR
jgi:ribose transport system permease protein